MTDFPKLGYSSGTTPRAMLFVIVSAAICFLNVLTVVAQQNPGFNLPTTVQLPVFGVAVSPEGVLEHVQFAPPGGQLFIERAAAARNALNPDIQKQSPLRKVSLARLQETMRKQLADGQPLPDDVLKLAGLQRIEYVFAFPDDHDIIIAGPAEGWIADADGRAVGMSNRRPVVLLEDLLTALRVFTSEKPHDIWVGCSIGSTQEGMKRLKEFQSQIPTRVTPEQEQAVAVAVWQGIENALGNAGVTVFGVPGSTNMSRVMIEADYRMKLIGIGREPPPVKMPVFFDQLAGAPRDNFQRWWFTPNYQCVEMTDDRLALRLAGQGVQLGTEEYKTDEQGNLIQLQANPLPAAKKYAEAFTKKYAEIAAANPVFAQLRNMIDILIVANFIQRENLLERTDLDIGLLLDAKAFSVETQTTPVSAKSLANVKWDSGHLVAPSGGVSILASEAFKAEYLLPETDLLRSQRESVQVTDKANRWWWD